MRAAAALVACAVLTSCAQAQGGPAARAAGPPAGSVSIVPQPRSLRVEDETYVWPGRVRIGAASAAERRVAEQLRAELARDGVAASVIGGDGPAEVALRIAAHRDPRFGEEGYGLRVRSEGIAMEANGETGLFYAMQTLAQITARSWTGLRSAGVTVVDRPEFRRRGIHLDVARHFFSVRTVERYLDVAARYKLNVFHWHLTDDPGWRLRSARYPALTSGGASYSAADVREIVRYAASRHITVVPEIDLPAHAGAVLRAYPALSCGHDTLCTTGAGLAFARGVLDEAMAAFPSPYVHAGGDEVPPAVSASQAAFTRALEQEAAAHGRRLAGWDDLFTPALSPRTLVTVWRGRSRAAAIARHGNDVVLASAPLYFDAAQGDPAQEPSATRHMATLEQVYDDGIAPTAHLAGVQGNLWTEHVADERHLFFMLLPRALALAEIAWTPRERRSWTAFVARLPAQLDWLEAHGYPFRIPNVSFAFSGGRTAFDAVPGHVQSVRVATSEPAATVTLAVPLDRAVIRYTTDGTAPSASSKLYRAPFAVRPTRTPLVVRAAAFLHGRRGAVTESLIVRVTPAELRAHHGGSASWTSLVSP